MRSPLSGLEVELAQWLKPLLDRLGHKKGEEWRRQPPASGTSVNAAGGAANWLFSSPDTSAAVSQLIAEAAKTTRWDLSRDTQMRVEPKLRLRDGQAVPPRSLA